MILDNHAGRGVQSADFAFRVNRDWDSIRGEVMRLLQNLELLEYMDNARLQKLLDEIGANAYHFDKATVAEAAVVSSLSSFLEIAKQG